MDNRLTRVVMYSDGACIPNPGPGGYGVVLLCGPRRRELSGGYRRSTNNRMELRAAIAGLAALRERCHVLVQSDAAYLVDAMRQGWARGWRARGWRRSGGERALNPDLWTALLDLCDVHVVEFRKVQGHAGEAENERCDQLAKEAATGPDLAVDEGYEASV